MSEDYLIQEFHDAGIYLPEELQTIREGMTRIEQRLALQRQHEMQALRTMGLQDYEAAAMVNRHFKSTD